MSKSQLAKKWLSVLQISLHYVIVYILITVDKNISIFIITLLDYLKIQVSLIITDIF